MVRKALALAVMALALASGISAASPAYALNDYIYSIIRSVDYDSVLELALRIASLGSRAPGYAGYNETASLILSTATRLGLKVYQDEYQALVPCEGECYVEIGEGGGARIRVHPLWPNGVVEASPTPPEGLAGELVYGGSNPLEELRGVNVTGKVVLLDFDSGASWIDLMKLGAVAVVYVPRGPADRYEAFSKFTPVVPVRFVRVYADTGVDKLLEASAKRVKVVIHCDYGLRRLSLKNIVLEIPGREKPNEIVALIAHFDSWSVVPARASSAEEALGPALLLKLAEVFRDKRPARTVWLVFVSGHWNGLAGSRKLAEWILSRSDLSSGKRVILAAMGVDISSDFPGLSLIYAGHFYAAWSPLLASKFRRIQDFVAKYVSAAGEFLNETDLPASRGLRAALADLGLVRYWDLGQSTSLLCAGGTMATPYVLDTEPLMMIGLMAFTARTQFSWRPLEGIPFPGSQRLVERFKDYVIPQLASVAAIAAGLAEDPDVDIPYSTIKPTRMHALMWWGSPVLVVKVLEYNVSKGWYDPVSHALVRVSRSTYNPFAWIVEETDENGTCVVYGLSPQTYNSWYIDAYKPVNETWAYLPAYGVYSQGSATIAPIVPKVYATVYVKPMEVHYMLDFYDPRIFRRAAILDPRYNELNTWLSVGRWASIYDTRTGAPPIFSGGQYWPYSLVSLLASDLTGDTTLTLSIGTVLRPVAIVERPRHIVWALDYAKGTLEVARRRYSLLSSKEVRRLSAEILLSYAEEYLKKAIDAYRRGDYVEAQGYSMASWGYASRAYVEEVMPLFEESTRSVLVFVGFVTTCAYFMERLLAKTSGLRRFATLALFEVLFMAAFAYTHPAFWVIPAIPIASLSVGVLMLIAFMVWVLFREMRDVVKEYVVRTFGRHEVAHERTAIIVMAAALSTEYMRKRPLRTVLTFIPIITFASALVSLASISPYTAVVSRPVLEAGMPPYEGLMIAVGKIKLFDQFLDYPLVDVVMTIVGDAGIVAPRVWVYPTVVNVLGAVDYAVSRNSSYAIRAALGLMPEEAEKLFSRGLVKGTVFKRPDQRAALISSKMAAALGVGLGDYIEIWGERFMVVGIYSSEAMSAIKDFDGYDLTPINPIYYSQLNGMPTMASQTFEIPRGVTWDEVVVIPYELAKRRGVVTSVAVVMRRGELADDIAKRLAYLLNAIVYVGKGGRVIAYGRFPTQAVIGWDMMTVLFSITTLSIVVSMLGSVKERESEISTFSSLGLSPTGAMLMFITEFAVYGVVGATLGYFLGWGTSKALRALGVLPPYFVFNYSSMAIVIVMLVVVLSSLAAAAYPSYIAMKIVTPSLERKWKVPTKPRGDRWEIPLPFKWSDEREVIGLLMFLKEYYEKAGALKRTFTVVTPPQLNREVKVLSFKVRLYPFDMATEQRVTIRFAEGKGGWRGTLVLERVSGLYSIWTGASQYSFIDDLRKQVLLWGTLPPPERRKYMQG